MTASIQASLKDRPRQMAFEIEHAARGLPRLCRVIGADVDLPAALSDLDTRDSAG